MQSIKRIVIHEAVVSEILKYIKNNNLQKGDKLPTEKELTELLQVSRTSVREALKILKANNIVNIIHGSGIYVNTLDSLFLSYYDTDQEYKKVLLRLKDLAQARILIETNSCIEVSKKITKEQLDRLYELEEEENRILSSSKNNANNLFVSLSLELAITELHGNPYLFDFHKKIAELWKKYLLEIKSTPYPPQIRNKDHIGIIQSIASKNKTSIQKNVRNHIQRMIDAVDQLLKAL